MSPLPLGAAGAGASAVLRRETPSACSRRTVVASVNGRRPPSTFSSVDRLSFASSASDCREMRRRAISSRMVSAICRLCSAESCLSGAGIVTPGFTGASLADAQSITNPHKAASAVAARGGRRPNKADHSARAKSGLSAPSHHGEIAVWSERHDDMRRNRGRQTQRTAQPDQAGAVLCDAGRCRNPGRVCGIILEL